MRGIGLGVVLLVVGAVLAFAVKANLQDFDLTAIGYILMAGGLVSLILALTIFGPRSRRHLTTAVTTDAYGRQAVTEREDRISGSGPVV